MSSWLQRVGGIFGGARGATVPLPPVERAAIRASAAPADDPTRPAPVESILPDLRLAFFGWLVDAVPERRPLTPREVRLLRHVDTVSAADGTRADLLPRAAGVIPQLMRSLRDTGTSASVLAERVARDSNLIAEVLRLAHGAATRGHGPVTGLADAIARIGTQGLRRAIATVVLKPVFDAPVDSLGGRAAARLWLHSQAKAAECQQLASAAGLDPFDGYLAGLLHNIGWSALFRALDRDPGGAPADFGAAFVEALDARRETLFGLLAMPWQLGDALTALSVELLDRRLADADSPLAVALLAADRHAALAMLGAGALLEPIGS